MSANFVLDGLFGFTRQHTYQQPPGDPQGAGDAVVGIVNACQPPLQRDYAMPRIDISLPSWSSYGNGIRVNDNTGSVFDYLDPQWQWVVNGGWNKGVHNFKFGLDIHRLHMNHYEITAPSFSFTGGATALNVTAAAAPNFFNGYADFLLGLPITRNTALQNPMLNEENGSNEQSATLRSWEYGIYIRDQFQLTRNITVSAGVRWEYYPVPQHADRGVEVFDFATNRLLMCGVGNRPIDCGINVQKDLFTPRSGLPTGHGLPRVPGRLLANPQNDNMIGGRMRNFPVNVQINHVADGGNNFTPVGSFSAGTRCCRFSISTSRRWRCRRASTSRRTKSAITTAASSARSTCRSQKVLPHSLTAQIGYVGNRQNGMTRSQNLNYSQIGGQRGPAVQSAGPCGRILDHGAGEP